MKIATLTFVEIILATVVFSLAVMAVIPTLMQASRNATFARERYEARHQAQSIMLIVRDAIETNHPNPIADVYAHFAAFTDTTPLNFSIFTSGAREFTHHSGTSHLNTDDIYFTPLPFPQTSTILVIIWCRAGEILGRAVGVAS